MEAVEIETGSPPEAAVIWLHGLGADGHDFEPIVPELRLAKPVRFVFPHAPIRPVTPDCSRYPRKPVALSAFRSCIPISSNDQPVPARNVWM